MLDNRHVIWHSSSTNKRSQTQIMRYLSISPDALSILSTHCNSWSKSSMFLDIYLYPHYQRRLLVLTLNSDHFHSRQKLCDIIDHGLAQQQQQPGRGGGLGPTDANMRIAGGGRERCGHWCGQAAVTLPNYRKMFSSVPPPPAAASRRQCDVVQFGHYPACPSLPSAASHFAGVAWVLAILATYLEHSLFRYLKYTKMITYFI